MDGTIASGVGVTMADPVVALITWVLALALGKWAGRDKSKIRKVKHFLPIVAVLLATFCYALVEQFKGQTALTPEVVLRGVLAAGTVVLGHSQWRELAKLATASFGSAAPDDSDRKTPTDERA